MPTAENCRGPPLSARPLPCASRKRIRISPKGNPTRRRRPGSINNLGDDVLVGILIRLPDPISACRCKSVCKRWSSLIFSPGFNRLFASHHQRSEPPPPLLPSDEFSVPIPLTFLPVPREIRAYFTVWDSFKDLVLCGFVKPPEPNGAEVGRTLFVCNPFTKQWVALPLAPERPKGYCKPIASLVCEPRKSIDLDLDDDNGRSSFTYSAYRFRVVCMYVLSQSINLDVFCSESREWANRALVLDGFLRLKDPHVVSWNGELVWGCRKAEARSRPQLARFNPFRLDIPPTYTDVSELLPRRWNISVSQGAFHIFELEARGADLRARVWRLEEGGGGEYWRHYEMFVKATPCDYVLERCSVVGLHRANPETVFLNYAGLKGREFGDLPDFQALTCNLRNGELGCFSWSIPRWRIFQPRVSCWPTPIPRYEELQDMYDGSYGCWVQKGGTLQDW